MLSSLFSAPKTMAQHAGVYISVFLLTLVQGIIFLFTQDNLTLLLQIGTLDATVLFQDPSGVLFGFIAFILNVGISIHVFSIVANIIRGENKKQNISIWNSLKTGIILTILFLGIFILSFFLLNVATKTEGWVQTLLMLSFFILAIICVGITAAFSFTFSLMGLGFSFKEALAQSWKITNNKWFQVFVFLVGILVVTFLVSAVNDLGIVSLENEWLVLLISTFFGALASFYSATAFANAIPNDQLQMGNVATHRHALKK